MILRNRNNKGTITSKSVGIVVSKIMNNKNITKKRKILGINNYFNKIYMDDQGIDILIERYNYLCFKKNMINGLLSGVTASIIFSIYLWIGDTFTPYIQNSFTTNSAILRIIQLLTVIIFIVVIGSVLYFVMRLFSKYIYRTFYRIEFYSTTNIELAIIEKKIKENYGIIIHD